MKPAGPAAGGAPARSTSGPPMRGPFGAMGPPQKSKDFKGSARRLLGRLAPERTRLVLVLLLAVASVALSVSGPRILGRATNLVFAGYLGSRLPEGASREQVIANLEQEGRHRTADLLDAMHVVPGQGIDFAALAHVLLWVLAMYVAASVLAVGARLSGQASCSTAQSSRMSACRARVESVRPVMLMSVAPRRLTCGTMRVSSSVSPELDRARNTSSRVTMPRSPWLASAGCTK